jgi:hypothetical protein
VTKEWKAHATDGWGIGRFYDPTVMVGMGETDPQVTLARAGRRSAASGAGGEHLVAEEWLARTMPHGLEGHNSGFGGSKALGLSDRGDSGCRRYSRITRGRRRLLSWNTGSKHANALPRPVCCDDLRRRKLDDRRLMAVGTADRVIDERFV